MLFRYLPSLNTNRPLEVSTRKRLVHSFSSTGQTTPTGIPKLPFKKEDPLIPKYLYDLQERMVTKFQFEKLIPDNLQQIYSEYVGQLEKDYAELYPLIKEFHNKTEAEDFKVRAAPGVTYSVTENKSDDAVQLVVTRPVLGNPNFSVMCIIAKSNTTSQWTRAVGYILTEPAPKIFQGTFYQQFYFPGFNGQQGITLHSFMTHKDGEPDSLE